MSRYLANKKIHPQKRIFFFVTNPFCVLGGKEERDDDGEDESLGQIIKFLSMYGEGNISSPLVTGYCFNFSLGTSYPCDTEG